MAGPVCSQQILYHRVSHAHTHSVTHVLRIHLGRRKQFTSGPAQGDCRIADIALRSDQGDLGACPPENF